MNSVQTTRSSTGGGSCNGAGKRYATLQSLGVCASCPAAAPCVNPCGPGPAPRPIVAPPRPAPRPAPRPIVAPPRPAPRPARRPIVAPPRPVPRPAPRPIVAPPRPVPRPIVAPPRQVEGYCDPPLQECSSSGIGSACDDGPSGSCCRTAGRACYCQT